ncbi:hypothetical protein KI387_039743, partial [Taxus chinensis]
YSLTRSALVHMVLTHSQTNALIFHASHQPLPPSPSLPSILSPMDPTLPTTIAT